VTESADGVLTLLKSRISSDNFVRLTPISSPNAIVSMLQCKLRDEKRSLTPQQWSVIRDRFANTSPNLVDTSPLYANLLSCTVLSDWESFYEPNIGSIPCDINGIVTHTISDLEDRFGLSIIRKICSFICCTRYGLREAEIFDLVMNDESSEANANIWLAIREKLWPLWKEYYVLGRSYLHWKNECIGDTIRERYLKEPEKLRATHQELANAFHSAFNEVIKICPNILLLV